MTLTGGNSGPCSTSELRSATTSDTDDRGEVGGGADIVLSFEKEHPSR